jgi:hypothetical protein
MGNLEEISENKNVKKEQRKHWLYILSFLIFFLLVGYFVKWLSAIHGLH